MHEGHRRRMYEKLKNDDGLLDHELLEILLFNAYPRINTNPIAHELIKTFGSLASVLSADVDRLKAVDGVGESVALYIKCVGASISRVASKPAPIAVLNNHEDFKKFVCIRLRGCATEVIELYFTDKNGRVKRVSTFTNEDISKVAVGSDKIMRLLSAEKPYGLFVAHNHLRGSCNPSENDDRFTASVGFLCSISNTRLMDHLIYYTDKEVYSYLLSGKLDDINAAFTFNKVMDEQLEKFSGDKRDV